MFTPIEIPFLFSCIDSLPFFITNLYSFIKAQFRYLYEYFSPNCNSLTSNKCLLPLTLAFYFEVNKPYKIKTVSQLSSYSTKQVASCFIFFTWVFTIPELLHFHVIYKMCVTFLKNKNKKSMTNVKILLKLIEIVILTKLNLSINEDCISHIYLKLV